MTTPSESGEAEQTGALPAQYTGREELRSHASLEHGMLFWIGNARVSKDVWFAALESRMKA